MARRTATRRPLPDEQVSDETTEVQNEEAPTEAATADEEAPVTVTDTEVEATDEQVPTEATEAPAESTEAAAPAEPVADPVEEIITLANEIVAERDPSTGTLAEAAVSKFGEAFRKLEATQKRATRQRLTVLVTDNLDDTDDDTSLSSMLAAKAFDELINETKKSQPATRAAAPKVDPTEAYVTQYLSAALAGLVIKVEDGVDREKAAAAIGGLVQAYNTPGSEEQAKLAAYAEWARSTAEDKGDEPEVPEYVKAAVKIADGKAAGRGRRASTSTSTPRDPNAPRATGRNIAKHIQEFFATKEVGEFATVAEIRKFESSEYGSDLPSAGAINARLFPNCNVEGIEAVDRDQSPVNKKGARKVA